MENSKPTPGPWSVNYSLDGGIFINAGDKCIAMIQTEEGEPATDQAEAKANGDLIAAAPELFQMVRDLKNCIKRLTQDDLSQFDRDTEAQWEGEAHELLVRVNPNYYKNANE